MLNNLVFSCVSLNRNWYIFQLCSQTPSYFNKKYIFSSGNRDLGGGLIIENDWCAPSTKKGKR